VEQQQQQQFIDQSTQTFYSFASFVHLLARSLLLMMMMIF
jgi:hypothetical protein